MKARAQSAVLGMALGLLLPLGAQAGSITPATVDATIDVGETLVINKEVFTDEGGVSKADVFFLMDDTGSMGGTINAVKAAASALLTQLQGQITDVAFGVGSYDRDPSESTNRVVDGRNVDPIGPALSSPYTQQQAVTTNTASVQNAINSWAASGGGDLPEANFFALHQIATDGAATDGLGTDDAGLGTGLATGWRPGAARFVVWFGDASSHTATVDEAEAIAALTANNVTVIGMNNSGAGSGIDLFSQASNITNATGGVMFNNFSSTPTSDVAGQIADLVGEAGSTLDLTLEVDGGIPDGLDISFTCTSVEGCDDVEGGESRTFDMTITGLAEGIYNFNVIAPGVAGAVERDRIVVGEPTASVPVPSSLALFGVALLGLFRASRTR